MSKAFAMKSFKKTRWDLKLVITSAVHGVLDVLLIDDTLTFGDCSKYGAASRTTFSKRPDGLGNGIVMLCGLLVRLTRVRISPTGTAERPTRSFRRLLLDDLCSKLGCYVSPVENVGTRPSCKSEGRPKRSSSQSMSLPLNHRSIRT